MPSQARQPTDQTTGQPTDQTTSQPTDQTTSQSGAKPAPSGEIVVTGVRAAIQKALEVKRHANLIVDSISAEDIGKLPDNNIAEAIQRVPGVSIDREGGEGRHITINGLGPEFSLTLFNGRQIATSDGGRSFSYDTIASNLVSRIDVYKTINANNLEGGLAGTVDVRTARPFDFKGFTASAIGSYQYDDNSLQGHPQASFLVSDRFMDGRLGVLVSFTHQQRHNVTYGSNDGSWSLNYFVDPLNCCYAVDESDNAWRSYDIHYDRQDTRRTRNGGTAVLQFQATPTLTLTADYLYSKFNSATIDNFGGAYLWAVTCLQEAPEPDPRTGLPACSQATPLSIKGPHGYSQLDVGTGFNISSMQFGQTSSYRRTTTQLAGFNAAWNPANNFKGVFDAYWSKAVDNNPGLNQTYDTESNGIPGYLAVFPADGSTPYFDMEGLAANDPQHLAALTIHQIYSNGTVVHANNKGLTADFDWAPVDRLHVRFGANYATQSKKNDYWATPSDIANHLCQNAYNQTPVGAGCGPIPDAQIFPTTVMAGQQFGLTGDPFPILMVDGNAVLAFASNPANIASLEAEAAADRAAGAPNTRLEQGLAAYIANGNSFAPAFQPFDSIGVTERDLGLYGQVEGRIDLGSVPVTVVAGVRYSKTDLHSTGTGQVLIGVEDSNIIPGNPPKYVPILDQTGTAGTPVDAKNSYHYFLPSINAKAELTRDLIFRLAATETMTRPTLGDLGPGLSFAGNLTRQRTASGNNPYLKPYTAKNLDASLEWYYSRNSAFAVAGFYKKADGFILDQAQPEQIPTLTQIPANSPLTLAQWQTFEVTRPHNIGTATIKGLTASWTQAFSFGPGFQLNYTKVWSKTKTTTGQTFDVPGISDTANAVLFYEKGIFSARVAYNWRSGYLIDPPSSDGLTLGVHGNTYHQIDARIGLKFDGLFDLGLSVTNLTKEPVKSYAQYPDQFVSYLNYGRQWELSVSKKF